MFEMPKAENWAYFTPMTQQIGKGRADGVQKLLNAARGDTDAVRDDLRDYVVENLDARPACWCSSRSASRRRARSRLASSVCATPRPEGSETAN